MPMNTLCRICSCHTNKFINIFGDAGQSSRISMKIFSYLQIMVSINDGLPQIICTACYTQLDAFHAFFERSRKAQEYLEKLYESVNKKNRDELIIDNLQVNKKETCDISQLKLNEIKTGTNEVVARSQQSYSELELSKRKCDRTIVGVTKSLLSEKKDLGKDELKESTNTCNIRLPRVSNKFQEYPWSCTICEDLAIDSFQELFQHYKLKHHQAPIFKCISCDKQYDRYRNFSRHFKLHQDPKKFACETCGKTFSRRAVFESHKTTVHSNSKPHACGACDKSFKNIGSLRVHKRSHASEDAKEKFQCNVCQKEFSTKYTLGVHCKIHTGERNFMCDICGKSFIAKGTLTNHLLSHSEDRNFKCPTCGRAFKTAVLLGKHSTLHSVIKPYQCNECGKQFRERGAMKEHSRIHTGTMPYSCEFCDKRFRFTGILTIHRRQHTGERPYACTECQRNFTNWGNYNKHMKRMHRCDKNKSKDG